jgi:hypothetical protein
MAETKHPTKHYCISPPVDWTFIETLKWLQQQCIPVYKTNPTTDQIYCVMNYIQKAKVDSLRMTVDFDSSFHTEDFGDEQPKEDNSSQAIES